ncbi:transient receptor potential cation channel subfamily A member 1 homolog [Styela clava]
MVKLLLDKGAEATEIGDGWNALDVAADNRNNDCAMEIINRKDWMEVLKFETKSGGDEEKTTTMRRLIMNLPIVAKQVFNKCCKQEIKSDSERRTSSNYDSERATVSFLMENIPNYILSKNEICNTRELGLYSEMVYFAIVAIEPNLLLEEFFNKKTYYEFKFLEDGLENSHCLMSIVESNDSDLLCHPLVKRLLRYKWEDKHLRLIFWLIFFLYLCFMIPFNVFMMTIPPPYATNSSNGTCEVISEAQQEWGDSCDFKHGEWIAGYIAIGAAILNLIKEFVQMYGGQRAYFRDPTNWIELSLYGSAIAAACPFTEYTQTYGILEVQNKFNYIL